MGDRYRVDVYVHKSLSHGVYPRWIIKSIETLEGAHISRNNPADYEAGNFMLARETSAATSFFMSSYDALLAGRIA